jgi:hypothetical protein
MTDRPTLLRQLASTFAWELAGISPHLWPKAGTKRWTMLRESWELIEPQARAGQLEGSLRFCNYARVGWHAQDSHADGWRPRAFWLWTRPDLAHLEHADAAERVEGLRAAGELLEHEVGESTNGRSAVA